MKLRISDIGFRIAFLLFLVPVLLPGVARAESSALILGGVPGSPQHAKKFNDWIEGTRKALVDTFGFTDSRVLVVSDPKNTKADIQEAFARLKQQLKTEDQFFLFFVGHGQFSETDYKFSIAGPDFTAKEYSQMLSTLSAGRVVVVNGTNSSGGGIEAFGGKGRVVITATRAGTEGNDTVFYEYFLKAMQDPAADEDKDRKLSAWEAFKYAANGVERFYKDQDRLATEHSLISDNGAPKVAADVKETPIMARMTTFQVDRPMTAADARTQAMLNERLAIELKINTLKINKSTMPEEEYNKQLDELQLQLALKNQQIKEQDKEQERK